MRNIGTADAHFSLKAGAPFSVNPSHASIRVGDSMQVSEVLRLGEEKFLRLGEENILRLGGKNVLILVCTEFLLW